jgi:hypothetical protein
VEHVVDVVQNILEVAYEDNMTMDSRKDTKRDNMDNRDM